MTTIAYSLSAEPLDALVPCRSPHVTEVAEVPEGASSDIRRRQGREFHPRGDKPAHEGFDRGAWRHPVVRHHTGADASVVTLEVLPQWAAFAIDEVLRIPAPACPFPGHAPGKSSPNPNRRDGK